MSTIKAAIISDELDNLIATTNVVKGSAKVSAKINQNTTHTLLSSFNVSGIVDVGGGATTLSTINSFVDTMYNVLATESGGSRYIHAVTNQAAGQFYDQVYSVSAAVDGNPSLVGFGDLA